MFFVKFSAKLRLALSGVGSWPIRREDCYLLNPRQ